jgi:hypothetical protein
VDLSKKHQNNFIADGDFLIKEILMMFRIKSVSVNDKFIPPLKKRKMSF